MEVLVSVIGQKLRISTNAKTFVEGTRNFIKFIFSLSDEWTGLEMTAQFIQDGVAYDRQLDSSYSVFLPDEIHDGKILNIKRSNHMTDGKEDIYVFATLEEMREYLQI